VREKLREILHDEDIKLEVAGHLYFMSISGAYDLLVLDEVAVQLY
jgi:hypothetical protein